MIDNNELISSLITQLRGGKVSHYEGKATDALEAQAHEIVELKVSIAGATSALAETSTVILRQRLEIDELRKELAAIKAQEPVVYGFVNEYGSYETISTYQDGMDNLYAAPVAPTQPDHTRQANEARAAASNHTRDIVKLSNEARQQEQKGGAM